MHFILQKYYHSQPNPVRQLRHRHIQRMCNGITVLSDSAQPVSALPPWGLRYTASQLKRTPANANSAGPTKGGCSMQFKNQEIATKSVADCKNGERTYARWGYETKALLSTRAPLATPHRSITLQQPCRWQTQGLRKTANIYQSNIALPTLHTAKVAARQTTVQCQTLLRHALCPAQRRHMLPKPHHGVVRQRSQSNGNRRVSGFGGGEFGHRLSVKNSPLSGYAL